MVIKNEMLSKNTPDRLKYIPTYLNEQLLSLPSKARLMYDTQVKG